MSHTRTALRRALRAAFRGPARSRSSSMEVLRFTRATRVVHVPAPAGVGPARLRLRLAVGEGAARWELLDPAGQVRAEGAAAGGDTLDEALRGAAGWMLRLTLDGATGDFSAGWEAP